MANFNDRQATQLRLSKLRLEIQQLSESLNRPIKSRPTSSNYNEESKSQPAPSPRYTSELEAKYLGKRFDSSQYMSTSGQLSKRSPSWTSDRASGVPEQCPDVPLDSSVHSTRTAISYEPHASTSFYQGMETTSTLLPATQPFSLSGKLAIHRPRETSQHSSFEDTRTLTQYQDGSLMSSGSRLKEIEDKYLHHNIGSVLTKQRSDTASSPFGASTSGKGLSSHSLSSLRQSRTWTSPRLKEEAAVVKKVEPTSPVRSSSSSSRSYRLNNKHSKYSWRQPSTHTRSDDDRRPSSRSEPSRTLSSSHISSGSRGRASLTEREAPRHRSSETARTRTSESHSSHRKPHSSHPAHQSSTLSKTKTSSSQSSSHYTSRSKPKTTASSSETSRSSSHQSSTQRRSHDDFRSRSGSGYISSRARGTTYTRGRGFSGSRSLGRDQGFLSSRGHTFLTRRGRGYTTFRGRGWRGYSSPRGRGRVSTRSRGGFVRGHSSPSTSRHWRASDRDSYHGKERVTPSSSRKSTQSSFHSRYALRTSGGRHAQKRPLSFMEKRRQTVLSNTPVLLRSRYNLVKGHRSSVHKPSSSSMTSSLIPARKTASVKRLMTVKNTKTRLIRRAEGEKRSPGSLVTLQGSKYKLRINRFSKSLHRIPSSSQSTHRRDDRSSSDPSMSRKAVQTASRASRRLVVKSTITSVTRKVASHVLQRSIYTSLAAKHRTKQQASTRQYCKFYNLYGRCKRGDDCPYIHDPEKVAVCTRFLRGTCPKTDGSCLFSHKVSKEKMAVCSYFLRGVCNRDDCPYSHVKVSSTATVCPDFIKGYCPRGAKCKKKHVLHCAEYTKTGKCRNGKKCPLLHKRDSVTTSKGKTKTKTRPSRGERTEAEGTEERKKRPRVEETRTNTPSFIKLPSDSALDSTAPSLPASGEAGSSVPSRDASSAENLPPTTRTSDDSQGSSIIPSFIRLRSSERIKKTAPSTAVKQEPVGSLRVTRASARKAASTRPSIRSPHRSKAAPGETSGQSSSAKPDGKDGTVTATSCSSEGDVSGSSMPSFIELFADGTLDDSMEDSSDTGQDHKEELQIRPKFLR